MNTTLMEKRKQSVIRGGERVTDKEREKRRERDKEVAILAHAIAKTAVSSIENTTYSEAILILEDAKDIVVRSMQKQKAEVPSEIRDKWGVVIKMSETEASDT